MQGSLDRRAVALLTHNAQHGQFEAFHQRVRCKWQSVDTRTAAEAPYRARQEPAASECVLRLPGAPERL